MSTTRSSNNTSRRHNDHTDSLALPHDWDAVQTQLALVASRGYALNAWWNKRLQDLGLIRKGPRPRTNVPAVQRWVPTAAAAEQYGVAAAIQMNRYDAHARPSNRRQENYHAAY